MKKKFFDSSLILLKSAGFFGIGIFFGYLKALHLAGDLDSWANDDKLLKYECEDQLNLTIQKEQKPAVIYYSLSKKHANHLFRGYMMKYSHLYPDDALWVIINVQQNFQQIRKAFSKIKFFHPQIRLEIRFPKKELAYMQLNPKYQMQLLDQRKGNRRQIYNLNAAQWDFKNWLIYYGVIKVDDNVNSILKCTENALFNEFSL